MSFVQTAPNNALLNGRRSLSGVLLLDSLTLSYAMLALLLSTHIDLVDIGLLLVQIVPHLFTSTIVYVVVRHSFTVNNLLRVAALLYSLCFVVDAAIAFLRFCLFIFPGEGDATLTVPLSPRLLPMAHAVRIAVALLFLFVDLVGVVFADLSQSTAHIGALRTNEQLFAYESNGASGSGGVASVVQSGAQQQLPV